MKVFDGVDPTNCYQRPQSIVPQQALALANSKLSLTQSRLLAQRIGGADRPPDLFLAEAYESILGRPPSSVELASSMKFLERQETITKSKLRAREDLIHALFNRSEFVTIR